MFVTEILNENGRFVRHDTIEYSIREFAEKAAKLLCEEHGLLLETQVRVRDAGIDPRGPALGRME